MKNNLNGNSVVIKMDINKNHIDHFILETDEGTKKVKDAFYKQAAENRNHYIDVQLEEIGKCKSIIEREISKRLSTYLSCDKSSEYEKEEEKVDEALELVKLHLNISTSFKLGLDYWIASIDDDASLEMMNTSIQNFIDAFHTFGIDLTIDDFKYTMFTEKYMNTFFEKGDLTSSFEKIYFSCPSLKLQLKMNLSFIVKKYNDALNTYLTQYKNNLYQKFNVTDDNVIEHYISLRKDLGVKMAMDPYSHLKSFLDGDLKITDYLEDSTLRVKNYNLFAMNDDYAALSDDEKKDFNAATMDLYVTLNVLDKYYKYENVIKDLLKRYKDKDSVKSQFTNKKKELDKAEKERLGIYKDYLKANGIGFFAKYNEDKIKNSMLRMNEQVKMIHDLQVELEDLEITNNLNLLSDSSSIYDLLNVSLLSFPFLEKNLEKDEDFDGVKLEDIIHEYFRFIYNPNNGFMRKINVLTDYNIASIVAEKFRLLKLNITDEMLSSDNLSLTMESARFINVVQNVDRSDYNVHMIDNICRMNEIVKNEVI